MRELRRTLQQYGQSSDAFVANLVRPHLDGASLVDVGCGSGVQAALLRAAWAGTPAFRRGIERPWLLGIDRSARASCYAARYGPYDEVILGDSTALPLVARSVDVALSLENLEHLYPDEARLALAELARVARGSLIVTTPWPWTVVNGPWLEDELRLATRDPDPLGAGELQLLAGCIHKCGLDPDQLEAAGLTCLVARTAPHPVYAGDAARFDPSRLGEIVGIPRRPPAIGVTDFRAEYVRLLEDSLALRRRLPRASARSPGQVLLARGRLVLRAVRDRVRRAYRPW